MDFTTSVSDMGMRFLFNGNWIDFYTFCAKQYFYNNISV